MCAQLLESVGLYLFSKLQKFSAIIFLFFFFTITLFLFSFWNSDDMNIRLFVVPQFPWDSLHFLIFILSDWIISVDLLSLSSQTLSFVISILLLSASSELFWFCFFGETRKQKTQPSHAGTPDHTNCEVINVCHPKFVVFCYTA